MIKGTHISIFYVAVWHTVFMYNIKFDFRISTLTQNKNAVAKLKINVIGEALSPS